MEAKSPRRSETSLRIPEGIFFEAYTPSAGPIISPSLGKALLAVKMYLSADATVTFADGMGNLVTAFPLKAGPQPFLVSKIITVVGASVAIMHDGLLASTNVDMTGPVYS